MTQSTLLRPQESSVEMIPIINCMGEEKLYPEWHPRVILQRHNDELAKKAKWKLLRPHDPTDLARWNLPRWENQTKDENVRRVIRHAWRHLGPMTGPITDDEVIRAIRSVPKHKASKSYAIFNSAAPTTAAPVKQPTGTAIRTMMQLALATGFVGRLIAWGCSFDGNAASTPGQVEVLGTTVAATGLSTAYAVADIQPYGDPNAPANTSGTSGVPFNLGTSLSGFATGAVTEGTVANYRMADLEMLPPTGPYVYQWPLGREFEMAAATLVRFRVTFGTSFNMYIWCVCEIG